jgi:hypothetical protein
VLGPSLGWQDLDCGAMEAQLRGDELGARCVLLAWRIDGRDANQPRRKVDDFISSAVDFGKDAFVQRNGPRGRQPGHSKYQAQKISAMMASVMMISNTLKV